MKLAEKVVLITGAGSGVGAATARLMAAAGAKVACVGLPAAGVQAVAQELVAAGHVALAVAADVADGGQVAAAVAQTVAHFGQLDLLVANAGIQLHTEDVQLHELPEAVWDRTHDVNYRGVYLTCKHGLAQMVQQGEGGAIVIVASVTALNGRSANPAYMSGKHGLIGLTRYIAVHYAKHGIRCNAVCPGALTRTPNHDIHPDPTGREAMISSRTPLGRLGRPEEIAPMIAFLCSEEASYATGAHFVIDGGLSVA
ncbi:MAG: SDR family oxidoreductase [Caldilineaceae bacterium]|nr:SDR family oxidoreductase [Caldilineaceae bacterium]